MTRDGFLALVDAPSDVRARVGQAAVDAGLTLQFDAHGLSLFAGVDAPIRLLPGGVGIVWGNSFPRSSDASSLSAGDDASSAIDRMLVQRWGSYVAFLAQGNQILVVRAPSGQQGCYYGACGNGYFLCSDAEIAVSLDLASSALDWTSLARLLLYREARCEQTALGDLKELLPGCAMRLARPGAAPWLAWSPAPHLEPRTLDFPESAENVRRTSLACIATWAERFARPLVELSGGLDSSIVAAGLAHLGQSFACVTYEASGADLNEVAYARTVASALGAPLETMRPNEGAIDLTRSLAAHLPNPHARSFNQATDLASVDAAHHMGADAFFSGAGGDNVFNYLTSSAPVVDRLRAQGPIAAWGTARDMSELCGVGRWQVLRKSVARLVRPTRVRQWFFSPELLARDVVHDLRPPPMHPWLDACARAPRGKQAHVASLLRIHNYLECNTRAGHGPFIAPLLSQPLVELCLSIPSWLWCDGGRNRAVARAAYAGLLPRETLERRTKGTFASLVSRLVEDRREQVRAMLLEGELARAQLLDRTAIEQLLCGSAPVSGLAASRLLGLVDAEAWAASWNGRRRAR